MLRRLSVLPLLTLALAAPSAAEDGPKRERFALSARGVVSSLDADSITVRGKRALLTCGMRPALAEKIAGRFEVGDSVRIACRLKGGRALLRDLRRIRKEPEAEPQVVRREGELTALSETALTVGAGPRSVTCSLGARLGGHVAESFAVGDRVGVLCAGAGSAKPALIRIELLDDEPDDEEEEETEDREETADERRELKARGPITALSASSITVGGERPLTCTVPARLSEKLAALKVGDPVAILCIREGKEQPFLGALELLERERKGESSER